ncbi:unnamed protein product [Polarella glacialis]|uniref:Uncharacterized protein n=1 Tax=Polarella glacialis TaxID=89957 RepID=A0A813KV62_POLGL|nr:unnamed protein product [Polarella glacialis]
MLRAAAISLLLVWAQPVNGFWWLSKETPTVAPSLKQGSSLLETQAMNEDASSARSLLSQESWLDTQEDDAEDTARERLAQRLGNFADNDDYLGGFSSYGR